MIDYKVQDVPSMSLSPVQETTRIRLERMKKDLESRIQDINLAIHLLEKNPEIEQLTDLLRRI